ncbi:MAG: hypothetical protein E6772_04225 [Dysgonomonas sp.]|nr:hypothetical protein [Dysgonomonas sp.]
MKKLYITIIFIATIIGVNAQSYNNRQVQTPSSNSGFDIRRLTFGGRFGLQFGDYTVVNIAPQAGYSFSDKFNAGGGFSYSYYKEDFYSNSEKWKDKRSYLGFNLYGRLYPVDFLVLMVQPEINRMWSTLEHDRSSEKIKESKFVPSLIVGGGLRLGPMTAMIQYDVAQNKNSPYGNNIFYSIGYMFGL